MSTRGLSRRAALGGALCACVAWRAAALDGPERAAQTILDWRETAALEHQDRMRRLRRLAWGRLGIAPEITEDWARKADLPRAIGVDLPVARVVFSDAVFFESDSAELTVTGQAVVAAVAETLRREASDTAVFVAGHTDSRASDEYNYDLSMRRARSAAGALFEAGVRQAQIWSVGFGEALPLFPNDSDEGRAANRRVEFVFARKPEAGGVWLAKQPARLCRNGGCPQAIVKLGATPAEPVTRESLRRARVEQRERMEQARLDPQSIRHVLPRADTTVAPLESAQERAVSAKGDRAAAPAGAPRTVAVIRREDPIIVNLTQQRVYVGRPKR